MRQGGGLWLFVAKDRNHCWVHRAEGAQTVTTWGMGRRVWCPHVSWGCPTTMPHWTATPSVLQASGSQPPPNIGSNNSIPCFADVIMSHGTQLTSHLCQECFLPDCKPSPHPLPKAIIFSSKAGLKTFLQISPRLNPVPVFLVPINTAIQILKAQAFPAPVRSPTNGYALFLAHLSLLS